MYNDADVTTVTLHAALDLSMRLPDIRLAEVQVCDESSLVSSGKGWNVSRALRDLGRASVALVAVGPDQATLFAREADKRLRLVLVDPGTITRINVTLQLDAGVTHVRNSSAPVQPAFADAVEAALGPLTQPGSKVVFSGSLPPGLQPDRLQVLWRRLMSRGHAVLVDTSGPALAAAVDTSVTLIKPNVAELQQLAGHELETPGDYAAACMTICTAGVRTVLLSMGAYGGMVTSVKDGTWHVAAPLGITIVNDVGAGDAFLAGYIAAGEGVGRADALRRAVAAGSASVEQQSPGSLTRATAEELFAGLTARRLG